MIRILGILESNGEGLDLVGDLEGFDGLASCEDGRDFPFQLFLGIIIRKSGL